MQILLLAICIAVILIRILIITRIRHDPVATTEHMQQANTSVDSEEDDTSDNDLFGDVLPEIVENEIVLHGDSVQPIPESQSNASIPTLDHQSGANEASSNAAWEDEEICIHGEHQPIQEECQEPSQCSMADLLVNPSSFSPLPHNATQLQQPFEQAQAGSTSTPVKTPGEADTRETSASRVLQRPARPVTPESTEEPSSLAADGNGQGAAAAAVPVSTDKPPPGRNQHPGNTKGAQSRPGRPPAEQTSPPLAPVQSAPENATPQASAAMEGEAMPRLARGSAEEAAIEAAQRNLPPDRMK